MIPLVCLAITGVVCGFALWTLRGALRDLGAVFDKVEHRAHIERHYLAGRIQRPDLFPTVPVTQPIATETAERVQDVETDAAAFEAAGRDLSGMPEDQFAAIFGPEIAKEIKGG